MMLHKRVTLLGDESGSIALVSTAMIIMFTLLLLPAVWNLGAIKAVRRQSQNGSDAAALSGAETLAQRLNAAGADWWGCIPPETRQTIVGRYVGMVVAPLAASNAGQGDAAGYFSSNGGALNAYGQRLRYGPHALVVSGVPVPPIVDDVKGDVSMKGTIIASIYHIDGAPIRSSASGEAYLDDVQSWTTPCPANPIHAIAFHYRFRWKVRLVPTGY
ncbi:MAG: Tad domain-containing protein [Herpetosiphonaceae bacterium]|nr:Tad domain-containing protein [Herpetosiphonaceae bacterium]